MENGQDGDLLNELSKKLNVLISLSLRELIDDRDFDGRKGRRRGAGAQAQYLAKMGLSANDIAKILDSPLASVRTLLTPSRRNRKR